MLVCRQHILVRAATVEFEVIISLIQQRPCPAIVTVNKSNQSQP